jgi:predicted amidohydrolase YtcJ
MGFLPVRQITDGRPMPAATDRNGSGSGKADLLIKNGKIIACDNQSTITNAISIKGGRILAVGNEYEVSQTADTKTQVIDVRGAAVIPGMIDGHAHLDREGLKNVFPSLSGCRSIDDVLQRLEQLVANSEPGQWIVTMPIGDPPYYFDVPKILKENRLPNRWDIDSVAPKNPVYIRPIWGFWRHIQPLESIANTLALEEAGLTSVPNDCPANVAFELDTQTGEPNGIIREHTFMPIAELKWFQKMPRFSHGDRVQGIKEAMRIYNSSGTTSVFEEHGCAQELCDAWRAVRRSGQSTVRGHLVYSPTWHFAEQDNYDRTMEQWSSEIGGIQGCGDEWLRIGGIFGDLGVDPDAISRLAAHPYTGWAGFNYDSGIPEHKISDFLLAAAKHDVRVSAIWMSLLPHFESINKKIPLQEKRWIMGHLGCATPDQIKSLSELGIVMTAHTNRYIYKNGQAIIEGLGPERENDLCPIRSLLDAGVHVGLSTDNVPTSMWYPVWQSVSRHNLYSDSPVAPDQALSRQQALNCATIEGAYLSGEENEKGSLEPGKFADLVILTDDPLTCPEQKIKDIRATTTIVNGQIVYQSEVER